MFKEVDEKGACRTGKQIPVLTIPGVSPRHCPALVVVLGSLQGQRCVTTGRPLMTPGAEEEVGFSAATGDLYNRIEHK